jgi:hypothetical protein
MHRLVAEKGQSPFLKIGWPDVEQPGFKIVEKTHAGSPVGARAAQN